MTHSIPFLCAAFICFVIGTVHSTRINLVSLGLAFLVLAQIVHSIV